MKVREEYTCPLEMTHDIIKGKWKPIIIWQLSKGSHSLSALKRSINGISQKMLIQHLNELLEFGMVDKTMSDGYPLKSEYFLTDRGKKTFEAIAIMQSIGIEIMVEDNRQDILKEKGLL
ncbi:helix-turn-helix transcriptional regulator [Faecalicatena sp. AGMB00832]|uniref:Helix-turn-helix transcriptional regulator n=1 Tax=Faecalicatena faecalis TaxID=2726362 RepID=A0ABS6D7Z6_9FIRM|nr:helix-turn-helix domain-containing protein [Faecalicatena faecalis]MBU3877256.1 helix-turn-helix transcriptional regulator [Faecalicatena faecalis]